MKLVKTDILAYYIGKVDDSILIIEENRHFLDCPYTLWENIMPHDFLYQYLTPYNITVIPSKYLYLHLYDNIHPDPPNSKIWTDLIFQYIY